jgi:hypothetical protein
VREHFHPPRLIDSSDVVDEFTCRSREQTNWLRRHGLQPTLVGTTKVFVITPHGGNSEVAYYAWRMAQLDIAATPARLRKGAGHHTQPVALLARLGVDLNYEGRGLGAGLLVDAITRLVTIGDDIDCRGLLIHTEDYEAVNSIFTSSRSSKQTQPINSIFFYS